MERIDIMKKSLSGWLCNVDVQIRVVPDTDFAGYPAWPDTGYPAK